MTLPGRLTSTVRKSFSAAMASPYFSRANALMRSAIFTAVAKSGLRTRKESFDSRLNSPFSSRSMSAPFDMRPDVVMPSVSFSAAPWAEKPPTASGPWATA